MFQDIAPHRITYDPRQSEPQDQDRVIFLKQGRVLLKGAEASLGIPSYGEARRGLKGWTGRLAYVFSLDGAAYHVSLDEADEAGPFVYRPMRVLRELEPPFLAFASATALHFAAWYGGNRFCGHCAGPMRPKDNERALSCPSCGVVKYPRISPVVIVGITDGESLLLAKNTTAEYKNYGLIAGFAEPGETLEAAVAREVMEEVGLRVKNLRYHKSQPWAFSQSLLMGFFADLDGDGSVTLDGLELTEARWFERSELPADESGRFSLTWDMIEAVRRGEV